MVRLASTFKYLNGPCTWAFKYLNGPLGGTPGTLMALCIWAFRYPQVLGSFYFSCLILGKWAPSP